MSGAAVASGAGIRWRRLLPALWLGLLLAVVLLATPAPFATLSGADAGRVVSRVLRHEAYLSLALGAAVLLLERAAAREAAAAGRGSIFSLGMALACVALLCTVAGHFGLQPMVAAAREGRSTLGFGSLHAASVVLFGAKMVAVAGLAWLAAGGRRE